MKSNGLSQAMMGLGGRGITFLPAARCPDSHLEFIKRKSVLEALKGRSKGKGEQADFLFDEEARQDPRERSMRKWLESTGEVVLSQAFIAEWPLDLLVKERGLVVEIDGDHHRTDMVQRRRDDRRDYLLSSLGLSVLRIPASALILGMDLADLIRTVPQLTGPGAVELIRLPSIRVAALWGRFQKSQDLQAGNPIMRDLGSYFARPLMKGATAPIVPPSATPKVKKPKVKKDRPPCPIPVKSLEEASSVIFDLGTLRHRDLLSPALMALRGVAAEWIRGSGIEMGSQDCLNQFIKLACHPGHRGQVASTVVAAHYEGRGEVRGLFPDPKEDLVLP